MEGVKNVVSKSCLKLYFLKKTNVDSQGRKDLARKDDHDYIFIMLLLMHFKVALTY